LTCNSYSCCCRSSKYCYQLSSALAWNSFKLPLCLQPAVEVELAWTRHRLQSVLW